MKAFPTPTFNISDQARVTSIGGEGGMDLRDWFAGLAMQVIMADSKGFSSSELVKFSYQIADLMIKARKG
jgi:hypothetical protein